MLQFIIAFIVSSFIISNAWSKCLEQSAFLRTMDPFAINLGATETINIPLKVDGMQACYHQKNGLEFKAELIPNAATVDYEITPLVAEFENIPLPETYQYIDIDYKNGKPSKVKLMSFLCSGEIPVGADALSAELNEASDEELSILISTGQMADNLRVSQERKIRAKVYFQFLQRFEDRSGVGSVENLTGSNVYIPAIISENQVNPTEYKLFTTFLNRTNSTLNGCSEVFRNKMQDFLIENVVKNQPFENIDIKKKLFTNRYRMKWTL